MTARSLMIQGTGSHVGKSVLTAALCRIFVEDGLSVAPFKPQNMALNSFVTEAGGEMGRAQVVQAEAAGLKPHTDMNPILLKPQSERGSQVIIHGKVHGVMTAAEYHRFKKEAACFVRESFDRLAAAYDLILIEGAGSPAEINLRENDIANMGTAHMADAPVILVGDIDRGGVFASLVGTLELLDEADRGRIKGFVINKFRGDPAILKPGIDFLEKKTGLPVLGVIPWFSGIYIQDEDSLSLEAGEKNPASAPEGLKIAILQLPRISNFTDFDPLAAGAGVSLRYVKGGEPIGEADLVILPGSKNTIADLLWLKEKGYETEIRRHVEKGGRLVGICGGYQMLGGKVSDPAGVEGGGSVAGLGYLGINTVLREEKTTSQVAARPARKNRLGLGGIELEGYEIHMGESFYTGGARPLFEVMRKGRQGMEIMDGTASEDGRIWGTYIHGIFDNDLFRESLLGAIRAEKGLDAAPVPSAGHGRKKEEGYAKLAALVREHLDMDRIRRIAGTDRIDKSKNGNCSRKDAENAKKIKSVTF